MIYNIQSAENVIATTKISNIAIAILDFSLLLLVKLSLLILLASFLVSALCFFLIALFPKLSDKITLFIATKWGAIESNSQILLSQYWKNYNF